MYRAWFLRNLTSKFFTSPHFENNHRETLIMFWKCPSVSIAVMQILNKIDRTVLLLYKLFREKNKNGG